MKKFCLILMLSVLAVGCSDPRDLVIPREASDMNEFSKKVKNLNDREKQLLNMYLYTYEEDGYKIPVGVTVKEAIEEGRQDYENRNK